MKFTVVILLLAAACNAIEVKARQPQKSDNTDKRELEEGNTGIDKRAPVLPTVSPSVTPRIEYAETKEAHQEKSPAQQIYATPLPQIAKISDVLTGHGPPFQAAIASHLYAPVSVYQPRLGAPTTYEVSPPIASQLAYSEHKISYQPPQNAIQYSQPLQYSQKLQTLKQANFVRPINFQQPYQQQILIQQQPSLYAHQPQLVSQQPIYQQIPQFPFQLQRQYIQNGIPQQQYLQQAIYPQERQNLVQIVPQPGITYFRESSNDAQPQDQPSQRESKQEDQQVELKTTEKQTQIQESYNTQPQGAISYASFSQSQPTPLFVKQRQQEQQQQEQQQTIQYQSKPEYQVQQLYRVQLQPQQQLTVQPVEIRPQIQYQSQQTHYENQQNAPSKAKLEGISAASTKTLSVNPGRQLSYFRPGPVFTQLQPQLVQPQAYSGSKYLIQSPQPPQAAPSFPPVQYFGKYAQSIFGGHQQQ